MRQEVRLFRTQTGLVVASVSFVPQRGFFMDGWTTVLPEDAWSAAEVGEAVLAGLEHGGTITFEDLPPLGGTGATPASLALGYETENALLAAGAAHVVVWIKKGTWWVTPMVNEGAGRGWAGHADAPAVSHEGEHWPAEDLGASVNAALDTVVAIRLALDGAAG
ncbi:hypothetical protein ACQBJO_15380 [Janibacter sp. G349]|uniref:hypothetical protein n=1 Tax=unclassified Janibacter TaxID=2649294 RepID=UPI0020CBACFD|nr:hypothetical protein [Janibacter sp. CX7]UTT65830.1 hypothetical protein NMQ01_14205 [Janibacter sp. CX7]